MEGKESGIVGKRTENGCVCVCGSTADQPVSERDECWMNVECTERFGMGAMKGMRFGLMLSVLRGLEWV